jgi:hypothetical protein
VVSRLLGVFTEGVREALKFFSFNTTIKNGRKLHFILALKNIRKYFICLFEKTILTLLKIKKWKIEIIQY